MAHLVLSVVGGDRSGLVSTLAETVAAHGGNWERSELSELAGAFAGIVLVTVDSARADELIAALKDLDGLLHVTIHSGAPEAVAEPERVLTFTVLGNDRPGIVRDVTSAISAHALSIDSFASRTLDAPMSGGTLFEAVVSVRLPDASESTELVSALERLASEIQVDLSLS